MVLSRDDFVAWRIDWSDKAANIATMVSELNLGLQSVVFIDDSPYERARVREALAEVYVPEWPQDPIDYVGALQSLTCFDTLVVSDEDRARTRLYAEERHRSSLQTDVTSLDDWLRQLDVVVTAQPLSPALLPRATQLLNKTNQMNLATRRLIDSEVRSWTERPGHCLWCISVSDRFGDAGLTGLLGLRVEDHTAEITDFVLSCRVFSRGVEDAMLALAERLARESGASELIARFRPTAKNEPCRNFLNESGLQRNDDYYSVELHADPQLALGTARIVLPETDSGEDGAIGNRAIR
jgi:FkbH-like protein